MLGADGGGDHTVRMEPVELTGGGLTPLEAVALGQRRTAVRLGDDARKRMHESALAVAVGSFGILYLAQGRPAYRWTLRLATAGASVALVAVLGTVVLDLT